MKRRVFLSTAASSARIAGANRRLHIGLIGCGGRGMYVARWMREAPDVEFSAVCDVWRERRDQAAAWAGTQARSFPDFRALLEHKPLDAVLVATPDHWHAIPAIMACEAGKHVYIEKPLAHNVREGRAIVEAARRSGRIVQAGTQHRSAPHYAEIAALVRSGQVGEVRLVRVWNYFNMLPDGIGRAPDSPVPDGVDWDLYLGPAPKVPFNRLRLGPTYRWFRDYAGGTITDFGVHRIDSVLQVMGEASPTAVAASGGRYCLRDAGDVPDLLQATYEFPGWLLLYETCLFNDHGMGGRRPGMKYYHARRQEDRPHGEAFYGTKATIYSDRIGYEVYPLQENVPVLSKTAVDATPQHARAFVECVRDRRQPPATAETAHRATTVAHLGNIALQTGRKLRWDAAREEFTGDPDASRLLRRIARKPWDRI